MTPVQRPQLARASCPAPAAVFHPARGLTSSSSHAPHVGAHDAPRLPARYAYCPNLTIIDTPGFILKVSSSAWRCGA